MGPTHVAAVVIAVALLLYLFVAMLGARTDGTRSP